MPRVLQRIGIGGIHRLPNRFREVIPENVAVIKASMVEVGLIQPITVRPCEGENNGYWLIAGAHRLAAAQKLKWPHIECIVVDGLDADQAEMLAVDENLARPELTPAERARHVSYRKELYERLHPETKHGATGRGRNRDAKSAPLSFVNDTAAKTGRSKRAVEQDATRGKRLGDDLERIAGTSLDKGTELDALADMTPEERAPLIEAAERGETVTAKLLQVVPSPGVQNVADADDAADDDLRERIDGTCLDDSAEVAVLEALPEAERERLIAAAKRGEMVTARTDLSEMERAWFTFMKVALRSTREERETFYSHHGRSTEVERLARPLYGFHYGRRRREDFVVDLYAPFNEPVSYEVPKAKRAAR